MNIVLSGAGKGIGKAVAGILTKQGHQVFVFSRTIQSDALDPNLHTFSFDLGNNDYKPLINAVQSVFSKVDLLINNAGLLVNKPFMELTDEDINRSFDVNLKAPAKLIKALVPMMSKHSHIVNISSMGGFQGSVKFPGLSVYSASKGALSVLTEALALEFEDRKISVNALALGAAQTEMLAQAFPGYKAPLTAEEMAEFIAWFTLNGHRFFNGKVLPVSISTP
ncbi:MAG: SDR family oxidoreductase [Bacteroidales bacterium]|nr:SDR family oxidoreductase [Bacteroidales bacterium]